MPGATTETKKVYDNVLKRLFKAPNSGKFIAISVRKTAASSRESTLPEASTTSGVVSNPEKSIHSLLELTAKRRGSLGNLDRSSGDSSSRSPLKFSRLFVKSVVFRLTSIPIKKRILSAMSSPLFKLHLGTESSSFSANLTENFNS